MRTTLLLLSAALAGALFSMPSSAAQEAGTAPLDEPGPALSVPVAELDGALRCSGPLAGAARNPILLVPGTNLDPGPNFDWNYGPAFTALGWPHCTVTLPRHGLGDAQVAAEYVVHALRSMADASGRRVDIVGFSQGGMLPRWALRFWPDTRQLVGDLVGLAPSNHGTLVSAALCQSLCPEAYHQQAAGSMFLTALNRGPETFAGIDYTVAYTRLDQIVVPNLDASGSSALRTGEGRITNVALQEVCPLNLADHLAAGSYDPVAHAIVVDALTHPGPASPSRIPGSVCTEVFQPGVDPTRFVEDYARYLADVGAAFPTAVAVPVEPPLACYVTASCAAAPAAPAVPAGAPIAPATVAGPSGALPPAPSGPTGPPLPATGAGTTPWGAVAGALVAAVVLRRAVAPGP